MPRENDVTIPYIWASNANTNIPANPIPGFAYRRSDAGAGVITNGQGYTEIFDSALFNQMMWLLTSVGKTLCENGVMPYLHSQHYYRGAVTLYIDYKLYQASREIFANETPYPVPGDASEVWVEVMPPLYQGATSNSNGVKGLVPPANAGQENMFLAGSGLWTSSSAIVPVGVILPFAGQSAPTGWLYCNGSEISRTTYSLLFATIGTAYGVGNGTSTFNLPDLRNKFAMGGGTMTDRVANVGAGLPAITHTHSGTTSSNGAHTHTAQSNGNHTHTAQSNGNHTHTRGTMEISGRFVMNPTELSAGVTGCFYTTTPGPQWADATTENYGGWCNFQASRNWTGSTSSNGAHTHSTDSKGAHTHATDSQGNHTHTMTTGNNSGVNAIYGASSTVQPPAVKVNYIIKY